MSCYFCRHMKMFGTVILMLGGNIGDTNAIFQTAKTMISSRIGKITDQSSLYHTAPWGDPDQQPFLNQAIKVETTLQPTELLITSSGVEKDLGKNTRSLNGPRTIDIDIMFFENLIIDTPELTIPHPRLHLRRFNMLPLYEMVPEMVHPVFNRTISELLKDCTDTLPVCKINPLTDS